MSPAAFEIEIAKQGWLDPDEDDAPADLCSHGDIRLVIGDCVILPGDGEGEYTISTSALALLRTLESDHSPERSVVPEADRLILHCGMIEMLSCPIGVDWSVTHLAGRVRLHDVVRYDSVNESEAVRFPGLEVDLAANEYRSQVVAFAEKAKQPFAGSEKTFADDYEQQLYEEFWHEYDGRLSRALPLAERRVQGQQ